MISKYIALLTASLILSTIQAQEYNEHYNDSLAKALGADDYGMKSYVLVMLKTGENKTTDKHFIDSCFTGHMANINRLSKDGSLVVAGPLGNNEQGYRGIFIFDVEDVEEAKVLLQTDPAVSGGLLDADFLPWYGSAALPMYLEESDQIWKLKP